MRALLVLLIPAALPLFAGNATIPGEVTSPYPTLINLSIEWKISGDDNLNGRVEVDYRRAGEPAWHHAMPLRRVPAGESVHTRPIFRWENKHSGSIFDLVPDTEYEIRLKLTDPDGGSAERTLRARTRPVPRPAADTRTRRVTPETFVRAAASAAPGDTLLLAPGDYGDFEAVRDGAPGRPIVFRSADGRAVFHGISLRGRKHVHLYGLTVDRHPDLAHLEEAGAIDLLGGEELVVRYCQVRAVYGIIAKHIPGTKNAYIADNVVTGAMPWETARMGDVEPNVGEGIEITGPGNVVCYNRVTGFRDNLSLMEDTYAGEQVSDDFYNNDLYRALDDAVEADFAQGNVRVVRNRLTNCFMGLSSQPGLGGPTYFIRNAMYNIICAPFKPSRRSTGDVFLHNTAVKVGDGFRASGERFWTRALSRNNLLIGGVGGGRFGRWDSGKGLALGLPGADETDDLDYDGFGTHGLPFGANLGGQFFESPADLARSKWEKHGRQVDLDVFQADVPFPNPPLPERDLPDLRLRPGSTAVDAGAVLANINEDYTGAAPDLGAYELGRPLPHYGPRPVGVDQEILRQP
jgi:hypothetical protein